MRTGTFVIVLLVLASGASAVGRIAGDLTLAPPVLGDLAGTEVCLYASMDDLLMFRPLTMVTAVGAGPYATFLLDNIPPGVYYLDARKDNDDDGLLDAGDFYGVYGLLSWPVITPAPIAVFDGQTNDVRVYMIEIPTPLPAEQGSWGRIKATFR